MTSRGKYIRTKKHREEMRNEFRRSCPVCGKGEIQNGIRLSVHHVDGDKMQGCDGKMWNLIALCKNCHGKIHANMESEFIVLSNMFSSYSWLY